MSCIARSSSLLTDAPKPAVDAGLVEAFDDDYRVHPNSGWHRQATACPWKPAVCRTVSAGEAVV
jgi:hypothetical protein